MQARSRAEGAARRLEYVLGFAFKTLRILNVTRLAHREARLVSSGNATSLVEGGHAGESRFLCASKWKTTRAIRQ